MIRKSQQKFLRIIISLIIFISPVCLAQQSLNENIKNIIIKHNIPAAGVAVINQNHIVFARTYKNPNYTKLKVTQNAMFQAASISKVAAAFTALRLASQRKINLDEDVNQKLRQWKIPVNHFTAKRKVTVRNILSMTSGLSIDGFDGYALNKKLPTLMQMLEGQPPANSEPVLVQFVPGSKYSYSSGGFLVLQQLINDVAHTKFAHISNDLVFKPLGMHHSLYAAKLHKFFISNPIPGFENNNMIAGGWYNYPELASDGLWTTAKDLAQLVIEIMRSYQGKGLLPADIARQMLTKQKNTPYGLGLIVQGDGKSLSFSKSGKNFGYVCMLVGFPNTGKGAVVMINSNNNLTGVKAIMREIENQYQWLAVKSSSAQQPQDEETKFLLSVLGTMGFKDKKLTPGQEKAIKKIRQAAKGNPYAKRQREEAKIEHNPFAITFFQPNYVLPAYYTKSPAYNIYGNTTPEQQRLRQLEFKAQFSFKVPLWRQIFSSKASLYAAYTQLLYWQLYTNSAYFRETNYQPELFVDYPLFNWNTWRLGVVHQSNGRGGNMERSWNRVYAETIFSLHHWMISLKPWVLFWRSNMNLYNPDIARYLGHGRILIAYKFHRIVLSLMGRNNFESGFKRGAVRAAISFPIFRRLHGYVQFFHGYGQSLIEYNHRTNSVGVGVTFSNWI